MLKIRFNRTGKRNQASYRLVLQEHTVAPGGRHIEVMGSHNPHTKQTVLRTERIQYWMGQGAQLSPTVHNLLVKEGVIEGKKIVVKMDRPTAVATDVASVVEEPVVEEEVVKEAPVVEAEASVDAVDAPAAEEKGEKAA